MSKEGVFRLGESGLDVSPLEQQREFSYQIRIYDRTSPIPNKVGEFASGIKNTKSVKFNFGYLRDGGCSDFSFILGDVSPFTIDYHYRIEFCFYDQANPWYSGYITKRPERGTAKQQTYSGYGYRKQLDGIRVNEVDTAQEVATIINDTLNNYITAGTPPNTDIVKDTNKIPAAVYLMVSTIYWDRIPASDLFERLRQLAGNWEWGVDEERDFYFRAISTQIFENFWIGKHLDSFKGTEDPEPIRNRLYVKCGRLTDGSDYVLQVPDPAIEPTASQIAYGLKEEVVVAPEFWPTFDPTNLVTAIHGATVPPAGVSGRAIDGNVATYWDTGMAQAANQYITVDLGTIYNEIARVVLDSTTALARDQYARGFDIRISTTGAFGGEEVIVFDSNISGNLSTNNPDIRFSPTRGRYVRITLTVADAEEWHLGEFEVYQLDTSDIERWANYILGQKSSIRKKASLTIKHVDELISRKHVIVPYKPHGQWGIYDEDGNHIEDYPIISIKYSLSGNSFDMSAELGELERESVPAEFKRQLQRLEEYNMSGVRSSDDLASGVGNSPLSILRTMIGKEQIETPHLLAGAVTTDILRAASVIASKISVTDLVDIANLLTVAAGRIVIGGAIIGGRPGVIINDGVRDRIRLGEVAAATYGMEIVDSAGTVILNTPGELQDIWHKIYDTALGAAATDIQVAGLAGDTDKVYKIVFFGICAPAGASLVKLRLNTDALNNYYREYWIVEGHAIIGGGAEPDDDIYSMDWTAAGQIGWQELYLYADSSPGTARMALGTIINRSTNTSLGRYGGQGCVWNNLVNEITTLDFNGTVGNCMGIGTRVVVFARGA